MEAFLNCDSLFLLVCVKLSTTEQPQTNGSIEYEMLGEAPATYMPPGIGSSSFLKCKAFVTTFKCR